MRYFVLLLSFLWCGYSRAQFSIGDASFTIASGAGFYAEGIALYPSSALVISNNVILRSSTPATMGSVNSIANVATFSSPIVFTGTLRLYYSELDLNGNVENDLKLSYKASGNWSSSNLAVINTADNYIEETVTARSFESFTASPYFSTLPVSLLSFTGLLQTNGHVLLQWRTAMEMNNSHFTIERSDDGIHFMAIGTVPAASANGYSYSFVDRQPVIGANFYRLRQHDHNGIQKVYGVRIVTTGEMTLRALVTPNPVAADGFTLNIRRAIDKPLTFTISNAGGQVVQTGRVVSQQQWIATGNLPAGMYMLRLGDGQVLRFQKQ